MLMFLPFAIPLNINFSKFTNNYVNGITRDRKLLSNELTNFSTLTITSIDAEFFQHKNLETQDK